MPNINKSFELIPAPILKENNTISDALDLIRERYMMIGVIINDQGKLSGIISPGDLRKAILQGNSVDTKLHSVMNKEPICVQLSILENITDINNGLLDNSLMDEIRLRYSGMSMLYAMIPVITDDRQVLGLISLESLISYIDNPKLKLSHRTVLVVGGAGYIGSILTRKLLADGWTVRVLDKLLYGDDSIKDLVHEKFIFNHGDAGNIDDIVESVEGVDAVIYLAELVGDPACSIAPRATLKTNYLAVTAMAHLCSHLNINRFVYTSSCSVYGASSSSWKIVGEDSFIKPITLYGRMKALVEKSILSVCHLPNHLFTPTILRLGTVFGNSYRPRFDLVVNTFVKNALKKGEIEIFGGNQWRPYIHVQDVAEAIIKILDAPAENVRGQIFNVGDNRLNYTINDLADLAKEVFPNLKIIKKADLIDQRNYHVDFTKIMNLLGFQAKIDIKQGMLEIKEVLERQGLHDLDDSKYSNFERLRELKFI